MKLIFKLAWRNIWRNKRRSALTILAILFAVFLAIAMRGLQLGTYDSNIKLATEIFTGYFQIQKEGFQDNPSLTKSFALTADMEKTLQSNTMIKGYAPRIYSFGLAAFKDNSIAAAVFGVDPDMEKYVSTINKKVVEGSFLSKNSPYDIVIGHKMLNNLKAKLGDTIVVLSNGFDGSMGNLKFRIGGISKMGSPEFDASAIFMNLSAARELLSMGRRVSVIAISITDLDAMAPALSYLEDNINDDLRVLDWSEVMPDFQQSIELDNISGILFLGILILVVAFGILNTVLTSVTERFREFGVMLAIGTPHKTLLWTVFFETMILTAIGLFFGAVAAYGLNYYIVLNPITFGGDMAAMSESFGFEPKMLSTVRFEIFWTNILTIIITVLIVFIYPGIRLYKLQALKGIRYT